MHLEFVNHCYKRIFVVVRASCVKLSVILVKIVFNIREVCAFPLFFFLHFLLILSLMSLSQGVVLL